MRVFRAVVLEMKGSCLCVVCSRAIDIATKNRDDARATLNNLSINLSSKDIDKLARNASYRFLESSDSKVYKHYIDLRVKSNFKDIKNIINNRLVKNEKQSEVYTDDFFQLCGYG